jgi:hypothetical protein
MHQQNTRGPLDWRLTLPFISRRRYAADLAAVIADRERLRSERNQFAKDRDAVAATACREVDEAHRAMARLEADLDQARRRVADRTGMVPLADYEAEKKRADRIQARLDQALGLDSVDILDGRHWQETRQDKGTVRP